MNTNLPFWNWSLKKTLRTLPDPLSQAQLQIFYAFFVLGFIKIFFAFPEALKNGLNFQLIRYSYLILLNIVVLKAVLYRPRTVPFFIHFAQALAGITLWIKLQHKAPDIIELQGILMNIMFSFFGLGRRWGAFYSTISVAALMFSIFSRGFNPNVDLLAVKSFGFSMIIMINFMIIMIAIYHYHTAFYKTLNQKNELNRQLQDSYKAKSDFLSMMSHELRTPLNSVLGISNLLLTDNPREEQKEELNILQFSAESLLSLINNVLDFNKIDSNNIQIEAIPFDLPKLLREISAGFRKKAEEKGLLFFLSVDEKLDKGWIVGDPTRLAQIMYNLLGNAIKFTNEGEVSLTVQVIDQQTDSVHLRFSVHDTGIGISAENQSAIFDPFKQASSAITRKFGGTGLGLAIVKHLLDLQMSTINLESELQKGARFYFDLYYKTIPPEEVVSQPTTSEFTQKGLDRLRILLAEDNEANVFFVKKLLLRWNTEIAVANDGEQVISLVTENQYDLILMDIHMPKLDGLQTAKFIRQSAEIRQSAVPIIALTASISGDILSEIKAAGMDDYLNKPFRPNDLYKKLVRYVKQEIA